MTTPDTPKLPKPLKITAFWNINLHADCPACKKWIDLLDLPGFWEGRNIQAGASQQDMEVTCPDCGHDFIVDTEY